MKMIKEISQAPRTALAICFYLSFLSFPTFVSAGSYQTSITPSNQEVHLDAQIPLLAVGPISTLDASNGVISVNGQMIVYDDQTQTNSAEASELSVCKFSIRSATDVIYSHLR